LRDRADTASSALPGKYGRQKVKNGILPATLSEAEIEELFQRTEKEEGYSLTVDLPAQTVSDNHGLKYKFDIAPSRKEVLLKGLDDIGTSLQHESEIAAYEKSHAFTATMYEPVDVKYYSNGGKSTP
jgi:3-isopropylmalate dehydratase small subunit